MNRKPLLAIMIAFALAVPAFARDKKKQQERAMIERMEAVPCGAKERGLTGLGSVFASIGVTHVNSDEKLCPQYLLRTDDMEYHVRPLDHKHPVILPVGKEGEFKISKGVLKMKVPDGDHKTRPYQIVAMQPVDHSEPTTTGAKYEIPRKNYEDKPPANRTYPEKAVAPPPDQHTPPN